jgi:hypothetical protein
MEAHWIIERVVRTARKTPVLLNAVLANTTEQQARDLRDGVDGWNTAEALAHMLSYEYTVGQRLALTLTKDNPTFPSMEKREPDPSYRHMAHEIIRLRGALVKQMSEITEEQWQRTGVHPVYGQLTLLELGTNVGQHDVDHIEQIARILHRADALY